MTEEGYTTPEGFWLHRPLRMPDARRLDEVFTVERKWDHRTMSHYNGELPRPDLVPAPRMLEGNEIGPFCTLRNFTDIQHLSLAVTATDALVEAVAPYIVTDDDHLYFELIEHRDRERCLVTLQYNHIAGSNYIAYLPTETVLNAIKEYR